MDTPLAQFFNSLNVEEREFVPILAADNLGLLLRSAINELDWFYYNISRNANPTGEQEEQFYLLRLGVARLIKLSLDARPSYDAPVVAFPRRRELTISTLEIATGLGMIEHGRRVAQTVATGFCRIEVTGKSEYLITLPALLPDEDYYDRELAAHYRYESQRMFSALWKANFAKEEAEIDRLLIELVYPFSTHFIGYGADPLLDHYFFSVAHTKVQLFAGYDAFHYKTEFGGISYQKYVLALTYFIGVWDRHVRFAEALSAKDPSIELSNVLTISSDTKGFVESIRDAVNEFGAVFSDFQETTLEEAWKIFEVLSASRRNTTLLARPASSLPLVIQCSDQGFIRCLTGANHSPMLFLLDSLRHHFPQEYDKHQQSREDVMQRATKRVLNECCAGLGYLFNIKVRVDGRELTDIDLVVTEESTGTVMLCQLKYQELYGADLHAKHLRTTRLKDQAARWLASLDEWTTSVGERGIRASLRLSKSFPPLTVYRVVISQHYAYPLKDLTEDAQKACATWYQLVNSIELLKREMPSGRTLGGLVAMLKKTAAPRGQQQHLDEPRSEWVIRNLKFTILQE